MSIRNNCRKLFIRLNPRIEYDTKKTQIDNITNKFANGEIDYNNCISQLAALGVTATALSESSIRFSYKNKTYTITQKNATTSTPTYTLSQLKNSYKFSDEIINKYFKKQNVSTSRAAGAKQNSGNIDKYVVDTSSGCKTISDVEEIAAKQYQKDMVLTNFLNDMNKQTNSVSNMQKASDGKEITKDNYKNYVKEITATLGTDTDAAKQKALDKLIKDYTQGNIAFQMMGTLFVAIGITDAKAITKGSGTKTSVTFEFSFNGKSYKMSCNIFASLSGTDKKTVNTYSANELKNIGATSKQIDKYFESISSIDGKSNTYKLRSGKTYTAFLKEVNTNPKNGDYTTTNSAGNTVVTTYKDNVKTKEVEYDKNGKVANETIYNKDGSKVVTEFTNGVKSKVTTYDKNGKVTKTDKYDKNGNLIKNGDYTTTNNAGNKVVTTYKDGVKTKEVEYDKNNKVASETVYNTDGTKTRTEYSNGKKAKVTTYDKNGKVTKTDKYDKNGNLIKNGDYTTTNNAGNKVVTTYKDGVKTKEVEYDKNNKVASETVYNTDGTKTRTEYSNGKKAKVTTYDKNGKVTKTDKYDKNGNLIKNGDYTTTNNAGNKVVTTYKDGVKTKEVEYDKNNKVLSETVYNSDGTKTVTAYSDGVKSKVTTYDKNDNVTKSENYDKNGNLIQDGEVKTTNAKGNKVYTTYKNGVATKETEYDKQTGNLISATTFNADGSKTVKEYSDRSGEYYTVSNYNKEGKITDSKSMRINYVMAEAVYTYNKNGELETKTATQYGGSGYRDKISTTITDKNGNKISETQYGIYWTNPITGFKSNYSLNVTTTYNGTKTTISAVDKRSGKKDTEITTDSANNTTTVVDYSSKGIKTSSVTTDADKNVLEEIKYDSTGKLSSKVSYEYQNGKLKTRIEYDKNGNVKTKTVYEYSDNTIKTKVYDAKGNLTSNTETTKSLDKNNREVLKTKTYNSNNKYVSTTNSYWSNDGESRYEDTYNAKDNGLISSRKVYNKKGEVKNSYTYTYKDVVDNRNYTRITNGNITTTVKNGITTKQVTKKSNGDVYTELFDEKTGKHTKSFYYTKSTGAVKTTEYNSKGQKLSDAKNRIPKSDAIAGETTKIYEAIANVDGQMYIGVSNLYAIKKGGAGDISIKLLRMAAKNYNSTPSGATKLNSVSQVDSKYREYVSNAINNTLGYLGYDSSIVKGYLFSNTSDIAKAMAKDSDLKNYVKKNIKALVNGQDVKNICLEFKSNKDLYNSFHNTTVVDSSLSGTKLTLTVMDIYDFNPNAQGSSNSAKLNRIASAAMKDGEIKPYYTLTKVTIDLTSLGFTAAQIQAMKS